MQRLHGMGEALYDERRTARCGSMRRSARMRTCSPIWCAGCWRTAPIPASCTAWWIRRCPRRRSSPIPWRGMRALGVSRNPRIPLPRDLYPDRRNSAGVDLADRATAPALLAAIRRHADPRSRPRRGQAPRQSAIPADRRVLVGAIDDAGPSRDRCRARRACARLARVGRGRRRASCRGAGARR